MFNGIPIIESPFCVEKVWNFPQSKHRSRRVYKKLIKRHGCQYYERPAAYMISGKLAAHPDVIKAMIESQRIVKVANFEAPTKPESGGGDGN